MKKKIFQPHSNRSENWEISHERKIFREKKEGQKKVTEKNSTVSGNYQLPLSQA